MVCFELFGLKFALDFTAPALFALLSMYLSPIAICRMAAACLLHECAHLLAIAMLGKQPALMRISAAGLRLETDGTAVLPLRLLAVIALSGPIANLAAAAGFYRLGMPEAAAANLSLCWFNLLPFRSTDGGALLYACLEQCFLTRAVKLPRRLLLGMAIGTVVLILFWMYHTGIWNLSLCGMLLFMLAAEFAD